MTVKKENKPINCCVKCKEHLTESTGRNKTAYGLMCDDCYYEALGKLIEEHPIGVPGTHRG
jgi:hypothetical protein